MYTRATTDERKKSAKELAYTLIGKMFESVCSSVGRSLVCVCASCMYVVCAGVCETTESRVLLSMYECVQCAPCVVCTVRHLLSDTQQVYYGGFFTRRRFA